MIDYTTLYELIKQTPLKSWLKTLPSCVNKALNESKHGDLAGWNIILQQLPRLSPSSVDLQSDSVRIGDYSDCDSETQHNIEQLLRKLHPWRKGPFTVFGIHINTEWRSDLKWNRLCDHIQPLKDRLVLDVGCGNGYHCWRIAGAGSRMVIGIDPYLLNVIQFHAIRHFLNLSSVNVLPLSIEDLPPNLQAFDTVFSMGVMHHRRSPLDHLLKLRSCLRSGGELILDSLVIDGEFGKALLPEDRYAKMRNVWFIPSCPTLESWLKRCGYINVRLINATWTTSDEQRTTDWMPYESLPDFLDTQNSHLTIEGLPAPKRAIFLATKP